MLWMHAEQDMPSHGESAASGLPELEGIVGGRRKPSTTGGESVSGDDVVFITIYKKDREWINETKGDFNREERLHEIIRKYRREFCKDAAVEVMG